MTLSVAVFGASGRMGQAQVHRLSREGFAPVAVTRHAAVFGEPIPKGLTVIPADYADQASLQRVVKDVDAVFLQLPSLAPPQLSKQYASNVIRAAQLAGNKRIILNSTMWAPDDVSCGEPFYDHVRSIEDMFDSSGLPVTIFRPVLFMDNLLTLFAKPAIVEEGVYRYCQRPGLLANWIAMDDVALFMADALTRDDLIGRRFTIGGPERLAVEDVVKILTEAVGRPIRYEYLPARQFAEYLYGRYGQALGPREGFLDYLDSFYTFNNFSPKRPFEVDIDELRKTFDLKLTTMGAWASKQNWSMIENRKDVGSSSG
jgi:uncharacterized protein YbjT (DUF2867 family)